MSDITKIGDLMKMTADDYIFLYGKLDISKIPDDILIKIMKGEDFSEKDEMRIRSIIEKEKNEEENKFLYTEKNDELNQNIQLSGNNNGFILGDTVHSQTL